MLAQVLKPMMTHKLKFAIKELEDSTGVLSAELQQGKCYMLTVFRWSFQLIEATFSTGIRGLWGTRVLEGSTRSQT